MKDILIVCIDGLTGFPDAISAAFPQAEVQLGVVHQIRNSIKYVASRDQKPFMADLKTVYQAETKDLAESNLLKFDEKWGKKYPKYILLPSTSIHNVVPSSRILYAQGSTHETTIIKLASKSIQYFPVIDMKN